MQRISTHILDIARGAPAESVAIRLERQEPKGWRLLMSAQTDADGRCPQLLPQEEPLLAGTYLMSFDTGAYFRARQLEGLYPFVEITFTVRDGEQAFHIPLLLSANGYTTYRGS